MRQSPKKKLRELRILKTLPALEVNEAHRYIDKGADLQLLYFWINLKEDKFHPLFDNKSVLGMAEYFINKFPDLNDDIVKWFTKYVERRGKTEINDLIQKLDKTLSNEKAEQQSDNGNVL